MIHRDLNKSWIAIDGTLDPIDYPGESCFRFPGEMAELVITGFSRQGDWVLDPFAGFGTTMQAAQRTQRNAIGFEVDKCRAEFAARGLLKPSRVINDRIENIDRYALPEFDLVLTSPPYVTIDLQDDPWGTTYFNDMGCIFAKIRDCLKPGATVVIEVSNIRDKGRVRPLAWQLGEVVSTVFRFQREIIRCNTGGQETGAGYNHSYLLIYDRI